MRKLAMGLAGLWLGLGVAGHGFARETVERSLAIGLSDLPTAVRATFDQEAKGGMVEELRKDTKNGKTVYYGEVVKNGKGTDLEVSDTGKLIHRGKAHDESQEKGASKEMSK